MTLVGPIHPTGSQNFDDINLGNLECLIRVIEAVNYEIQKIAENQDSQEESARKIGKTAKRYLDELKEL
jgi:hypothetical protein